MDTPRIIPRGYKNTEIGIFPIEWEIMTFGKVFDFKSTASNSRNDLTTTDDAYYIHYGDIHTNFHRHLNVSQNEMPRINSNLCPNATLARNGDWIMADASEDHTGICKSIELSGIEENMKVISGLHTFLLREKGDFFVPNFKGHLGEASYLHNQFVNVSVGLKVYGVTKNALKDLFIPVPPKEEQKEIALILSDADSQIAAVEALINKKSDIKRGVMQQILTGETRLKGYKDKWEKKPLGEICEIVRGQQIRRSEAQLGEIPVIAGGMKPSCYHNIANRYGPTITISGSGANAGYISYHDSPIFASDCSTISESKEYSLKFMFYALQLRQDEIYTLQTGGAQPHIYPSTVKPFELLIPKNVKEQDEIAEVITDFDLEIRALCAKLDKLKAIKMGMLQELITGKTRVNKTKEIRSE